MTQPEAASPRAPIRRWAVIAGMIAPVLLALSLVAFPLPEGGPMAVIAVPCAALTILFVWFALFPALGNTQLAMIAAVLFTMSDYGLGYLLAPVQWPEYRVSGASGVAQAIVRRFFEIGFSTYGVYAFLAAVVFTGVAMRARPLLRRYAVVMFAAAGGLIFLWTVVAVASLFTGVLYLLERVFALGCLAVLFLLAVIVRRAERLSH